jgi:hypothetical protein
MGEMNKASFKTSGTIRWPNLLFKVAKNYCADNGLQFASFVRDSTRIRLEEAGVWPVQKQGPIEEFKAEIVALKHRLQQLESKE